MSLRDDYLLALQEVGNLRTKLRAAKRVARTAHQQYADSVYNSTDPELLANNRERARMGCSPVDAEGFVISPFCEV